MGIHLQNEADIQSCTQINDYSELPGHNSQLNSITKNIILKSSAVDNISSAIFIYLFLYFFYIKLVDVAYF